MTYFHMQGSLENPKTLQYHNIKNLNLAKWTAVSVGLVHYSLDKLKLLVTPSEKLCLDILILIKENVGERGVHMGPAGFPPSPSRSSVSSPATHSSFPAGGTDSFPCLQEQQQGALPPSLAGRVSLPPQRERYSEEIQRRSGEIVLEFKTLGKLKKRENALENELEKLEDGASSDMQHEYKEVRSQRKASGKKLMVLESELLSRCNSFIGQGDALNSLPVLFSRSSCSNPDHLGNVLAKKIINILSFLERVRTTTEKNKSAILSALKIEAVEDAQIKLKILGSETHHGGTSAVLISFVREGTEEVKVVYKPRSAETECAILELFKQLNLDLSPPRLCEYRVLSMEGCSYWEYVEGVSLREGDAASFLDERSLGRSEKERAKLNLSYLHSVCKSIGVTDLHYENVIFNESLLQMIPIDMEVIKHGHATGLFGHRKEGPTPELSVDALRLTDRFNSAQKNRVFRNTPVATSVLTDVMSNFKISGNPEFIKEALNKIVESLESDFTVKMIMTNEVLEKCLFDDLENGDVPLFSQKKDTLYYGSVLKDECRIATLEPKRGST